MSKNQWDKTFKRMLTEADQKTVKSNDEWDVALQKLADEWNETAKEIQSC